MGPVAHERVQEGLLHDEVDALDPGGHVQPSRLQAVCEIRAT